MSFFSKIGKGLKKVVKYALPAAAVAAPFIPGVGGLLSGAISKVGSLFGGSSAQANSGSGSFTPDAGAPDMSDYTGRPAPVEVTAQREPGSGWTGALGAIAPIASGALNMMGMKSMNVANAQQAQAQMDFQNQQTSTSYQRGVADMKAAGLNPMLAYSQGGASSGSGAMATMGNELGAGANSALSSAQAIQEMRQRNVAMDNLQAQTDLADAQVRKTDAETLLTGASKKKTEFDAIVSQIKSRYEEDAMRTQIRLNNSAAFASETRARIQDSLGPGADLVGRGFNAITDARDGLSNWMSDNLPGAEQQLREWANSAKAAAGRLRLDH